MTHCFDFYYKQYYPALVYFAFRITNDKDLAEDCVQESFLKFYTHDIINSHVSAGKTDYEKRQITKGWLYATVKNTTINKIQSEQRIQKRKERASFELPFFERGDFLNNMVAAEVTRDLHSAINELPKECKKIFTSLYVAGNTVAQIVEDSGLAESTVKNQKKRGLDMLQDIVLINGGIRQREAKKAAPIKIKKKTGPKRKVDWARVLKLFNKNKKPKVIAQKMKISQSVVYYVLKQFKQKSA